MLEDEVDTLQSKLSESAEAIAIGDVQEAQLHAEDIARKLTRGASLGGRDCVFEAKQRENLDRRQAVLKCEETLVDQLLRQVVVRLQE